MSEKRNENDFTPYLVIRLMPAVYKKEELPNEIETEEAATNYAIERSEHWKKKVCLVWSEQVTFWIDNEKRVFKVAEPGEDHSPAMQVKGKRKGFLLSDNGFETMR